MKKNKKNINNSIAHIIQIDKIIIVCLMLMLLVIPLTMKLHIIKFISPTITDLPSLQTGDKNEIYTSLKFYFLLASTIILSILFLIKIFVYKYEIKKTKMNIFLIVFILLLLLSTILSPFKYIALFGFYNLHEGALTFLCYSFILFIITNISVSRKTILYFFYTLIPFILINTALSVLSFFGYNLLKFNFIKNLIYSNMADRISFTDNAKLTDTLYNMDFLSAISSLFICLFFILTIFEKRRKLKIVNIILFLSSVSMLFSSLASSGFIVVVILLPIVLIILLFKKEYKRILIGISLLITCSFIYIPFQHHNERVWKETFGNFIHSTPSSNTGNRTIDPSISHKIETPTSKLVLPNLPAKGLSWGSGRGYIWENTVPLIVKKPLLGYGLDTIAYVFPQLGPQILSGLGEIKVISKPHSLYLGIAYGTGIIGLIIFLLIIGTPIFKISFLWIKNKFSNVDYEILSILFLLLAYLIQGLVNDSNIGTDIIFYVFLGILSSIQLNKESIS